MIQSAQLRKGNLIQSSGQHPVVSIVKGIPADDKYIDIGRQTIVKCSAFKPIVISPLWLIDFHFHKDNYGVFVKTKDNSSFVSGCKIEVWIKQCKVKNKLLWDVSIGNDFSTLTHLSYITYIHQLQNIYFSAINIGKELDYYGLFEVK